LRFHRHIARFIGAAVAITAFAGCGIGIQASANPINVPKNLFVAPKVPKTPLHHGNAIDVYFLTNGHLVASTRYLPAGHLTETQMLQDALNALTLGPTTSEERLGVTTAMSLFPQAQLSVLGSVKNGVVGVDLDQSFGNLDATQQYQTDGQIVYTLTQFPGVHTVSVVFGGVKEAILPGGHVSYGGSVDRLDYRAIRPTSGSGS